MNARLVAALLVVYVIWGSTYLAMRVVVEAVPPFMMGSVRFLLTGGLLLAFARLRGAPWPTRAEWFAAAPVGFLMFVTGNGTVAFAEQSLSSGVAAVVAGTMPLWAAALGPLFGDRTTPREWAGLALGFVGVAVLGLGRELRADPVATAVMLVSPVSWALGSLLAKTRPLAKGLLSSATQMLWGAGWLSLVSLVMGERVPEVVPLKPVLAWVYLVIFGSLVAYTAFMYLVATARPAVATSYAFVNPGVAVLLGVLFAGEVFTQEIAVALVLIVAATVLVVSRRPQSPRSTAPAESLNTASGR